MAQPQKFRAVILEKDPVLAEAVGKILAVRGYEFKVVSHIDSLRDHFGAAGCHLAVVGDLEGAVSPFETTKGLVLQSPMASVILLTDASEQQVHEMAEGYGILGHTSRTVTESELGDLLDRFETIQASLSVMQGQQPAKDE
jgi:hypothetical protein